MAKLNEIRLYNQKAFTLLETVVVVAIIAIMVVIAYPSILASLQAMESKRVENIFVDMLRQARAEAMITRRNVMICTLDANRTCDRSGMGTLVMFFDDNNNRKKDDGEKAIHQQDWGLKHGQIILKVSASRHYIQYMGDTARPRGHFGHLQYCSKSENKRLSFKVILNMRGDTRIERADLVDIAC